MMLENFAKKAEEAAQKDGGYTFRDGIAYCDTCGEPRQTKIQTADGCDMTVWCTCRCMRESEFTEQNEKKQKRIESLQQLGNVSPCCTFDRAQMSEAVKKCRKYAAAWDEVEKKGYGLLLWGGVGTGKTFVAQCIANDLIARDIPVFTTTFSSVINSGFDHREVIKRVEETPLVVFDDLGAERSSEYALNTVFDLVNARYRTGKPMIVTTNLTLEELKKPDSIFRERIYDRIRKCCTPILFAGGSKREAEAADMLQFMCALLG